MLAYICGTVSKEMREFYNLKNKLNFRRIQDDAGLTRKLLEATKMDNVFDVGNQAKQSPYFKRDLSTFQNTFEIDPYKTSHCNEI